MWLRLVIYAVIAGILYLGIRSIYLDWRKRFRELDAETRERDLRERQRPDVIDLTPDEKGVFRPREKKPGEKD